MSPAAVEVAWRRERAGIVGALARRLGDLDLAEDAVSHAFAAAAARWPGDGVPDRPGAWLTTVAWRHALDTRRRERRLVTLDEELVLDDGGADGPDPAAPVDDDRLRLVLACCHPSMPLDLRVALTLRHVCGLTAREIAAALLTTEVAITKRLVRARRRLKDEGRRFELPEPRELEDRLSAARAVTLLLFNEGYYATGDGPALRADLCREATWLAEELHRLAPDPESTGLLALLHLLGARERARVDAAGALVPFAAQDRALWDHEKIARGRRLLALTGRSAPGPMQLQAAIAAVQMVDGPIPWHHVAALYAALARRAPSPLVALHHAVAVGRARGPQEGLGLLDAVDPGTLQLGPLVAAARADMLARLGDREGAAAAWRRAASHARGAAERDALDRRAAESDP